MHKKTAIEPQKNFSAAYFKSSNYAGYLERENRYRQLIGELHFDLFRRLNWDFQSLPVLDFGCAVGFVVQALRRLGYKRVTGYDISNWAVTWGKRNLGLGTAEITNDPQKIRGEWALMFALDVLEHIPVIQIVELFRIVRPAIIVVRIPIAQKSGTRYVLNVSERDGTHITRLDRKGWYALFERIGFEVLFTLNLAQIYDTPGVFAAVLKRKTPK